MTDEEQIAALQRRYAAAMHAVQSGVALMMNKDAKPTEPKHLRVGVNSALVNQAALSMLLVKKGIITDLEYMEALVEAAEAEHARYEAEVRAHYGGKVRLA